MKYIIIPVFVIPAKAGIPRPHTAQRGRQERDVEVFAIKMFIVSTTYLRLIPGFPIKLGMTKESKHAISDINNRYP